MEVCEVAVQILEEACNERVHLEYVVRCRPALDHLGEIGAPLLLRYGLYILLYFRCSDVNSFLTTSLGYQYLDGLDYITQEMDDWFLVSGTDIIMYLPNLYRVAMTRMLHWSKLHSHRHSQHQMAGSDQALGNICHRRTLGSSLRISTEN